MFLAAFATGLTIASVIGLVTLAFAYRAVRKAEARYRK